MQSKLIWIFIGLKLKKIWKNVHIQRKPGIKSLMKELK